MKFVSERIENILGKGENAGYQHFPKMFSKASFLRVVTSQVCVVKNKVYDKFSPVSMFISNHCHAVVAQSIGYGT